MVSEVLEGLRYLVRNRVIASQLGLKTAIWVGAIGATVAFVPVLLSPFRSLKVVTPVVEPTAAGEDELRLQLESQVADA